MYFKSGRFTSFLHALIVASAITPMTTKVWAVPDKPLTQLEKKQIQSLIKQYILDHPEVILESMGRHKIKSEQVEKEQSQEQVKNLRSQLVLDPETPVGGNVKGDITIVEFVDYRCGYCKRAHSVIKKIIKDDRAIRYVIKDFPILGPKSVIASRAALAVWRTTPEKHAAYHDEMMSIRGSIDEQRVIATAKKLGIDKDVLKKAMADKAIDAVLAKNFKLAEALNINGTPAFVIGDQLVPGAVDFTTLKKLVAEARGD